MRRENSNGRPGLRPATAIVLAAVLATTAGGSIGLAPVEARPSRDLPSPYAFALPLTIFPQGSIIKGSRADERMLEAASGLHKTSLNRLGHLSGFLQTAWWWPLSRDRSTRQLASIQYIASIFSSSQAADTAYGDAQASLWELGYPTHDTVAGNRVFSVTGRDGYTETYLLLHRGTLQIELRLRYSSSIDPSALGDANWHMWQAGRAAWKTAGRLSHGLLIGPEPPAVDTLTAIRAAPWGTSPVVKSPALMVLDAEQMGSDVQVDPGTFRSNSGPALTTRAIRHAKLVPGFGEHYVRTAHSADGGGWYDAATLYPDQRQAEAALLALGHANRFHAWLPPFPLDPSLWRMGHLGAIDEARAWRIHGETIVVIRLQNVLMVVAAVGQSADDVRAVIDHLVTAVPTWLHAEGTTIVTGAHDGVRLASINWYGAEENDFVVGGLDFQPYQKILQNIRRLGFNSIRLPFSNELVEKNPIVTDHVDQNPEFRGMHALDILDRIINYAGALGISIILDDHRSDAGWSTDPSGLWYTAAYPDTAFQQDWATMARRYAISNVVVGADLRNEPHGKAAWSEGDDAHDWHAAAERAGNAVLAENPRLLIIVEGIQYYKQAASYWWGGSLMGVADAPVVLQFPDRSSARSQLVYSIHDYGPDLCGKGCPWFSKKTTPESLYKIWEEYWGYIVADPTQPYAAPVWVGEFGTCDYGRNCVIDTVPASQGQWFSSLVHYIARKHVSWGYWAVNGTESTAPTREYGRLDWYGFFDHTWTTPYPWLEEGLRSILTPEDPSSPPPT